jgi:hypothetical protein
MLGGKKYNYESSAMIAYFKNIYRKELASTSVINNRGNSFKIDSKFILADRANQLEILTSATYGELSLLDNKINEITKNQWQTDKSFEFMSSKLLEVVATVKSLAKKPKH